MEKHLFISADGTSLTLPVTPASYSLQFGMQKTVVHLFGAGDYVMPGRKTASSTALEVLLPAQRYPFCNSAWQSPENILAWLEKQVEERNRVQYVITEASFSGFYYIQTVTYGEQDGTGDIYAKIVLQEAPSIMAAETAATPGYDAVVPTAPNVELPNDSGSAGDTTSSEGPKTLQPSSKKFVVGLEDNLWTICQREYHEGAYAPALANFNDIDVNEKLRTGTELLLPDVSLLTIIPYFG